MQNPAVNETSESKKAVFRRLVDLYAIADLSAMDQFIAPNYVGHVSAGDRDLEGFRQSIVHFHNLFIYAEDSFQINDQLVEGDKVATRMTAHVKMRATNEPVTLIGINIARIVDGKIVEEWNTWEQLQTPKHQDADSLNLTPRSN
jgi:predicted SnoaL-like aldol condensation-catalyzing enzyme